MSAIINDVFHVILCDQIKWLNDCGLRLFIVRPFFAQFIQNKNLTIMYKFECH